MLTDANIRTLKSINSIDALLSFLRNDLEWPISEGNVDEVTFTYEPDELGLKEEHAPKINCVYQIRPITTGQPWGIFFIDFENKKLPISLMRRVLNHLRVKNRGGSGQWDTGDLLFMTTYGEDVEGMREVAFAHFHQKPGDLPTLNVLQWDAQDTPAKLKTTYENLKSNLGWPDNTSDADAWRSKWRKPFRHRLGHTIKTSSALAEKLAELSKVICDRCNEILAAENEKGQITKLYKAFQSALIHDLKPEDFADTFAQTIAYGLFTAAVSRRHPEEKGSSSLTTDTISQIVPETSPFLREVLETFIDVSGRKSGIDFDEVGVQDIVELLRSDETDMRAILEDFGNRKPGEDPVIHFYEHYLAAYNKELKVKRGVFYTPQPVVSYIVRSVHELLQTDFGIEDGLASTITWAEMAAKGLPAKTDPSQAEFGLGAPQPSLDGLADQPTLEESVPNPEANQFAAISIPDGTDPDSPFVVILDPATGTATFLVEVVDVIWRHLKAKWQTDSKSCWQMLADPPRLPQGMSSPDFGLFWNAYVPSHLLPRIYGYELMMAPYAIAHMKLGLKLAETGYHFDSDKRVRLYLTNALEPATELQSRLMLDWEALAHEAQAVKAVKIAERFTVIIGNPPYAGDSANMTISAQSLVNRYRSIRGQSLGERKVWLQNDYVKFIAMAQTAMEASGVGIIAFITDNSYLDGPTFRGMRFNLVDCFSRLFVTNLYGSSKKTSVERKLAKDGNVFDIAQGVSILHAIRLGGSEKDLLVRDIIGPRSTKYERLLAQSISHSSYVSTACYSPYYNFQLGSSTDFLEYGTFFSIKDAMTLHSVGIQTSRDHLAIDFTHEELVTKIERFASDDFTDDQTRAIFFPGKSVASYSPGDTRGWNLSEARKKIRESENWSSYINKLLYRPFDIRWIFNSSLLVDWPRPEVSDQMFGLRNLGLCIVRRTENDRPYDYISVSAYPISNHQVSLKDGTYLFPLYRFATDAELNMDLDRAHNFREEFYIRFIPLSSSDANLPSQVFAYIYAILNSPTYRLRYYSELVDDFPRVPVELSPSLFQKLSILGQLMIDCHLMKVPGPSSGLFKKTQELPPVVGQFEHSQDSVWLDKSHVHSFSDVPSKVWEFTVGGYQVCHKWLKDRKGRTLSHDDIRSYEQVIYAIHQTIQYMAEIDEAIESHGGWPDAFKSSEYKQDGPQ